MIFKYKNKNKLQFSRKFRCSSKRKGNELLIKQELTITLKETREIQIVFHKTKSIALAVIFFCFKFLFKD